MAGAANARARKSTYLWDMLRKILKFVGLGLGVLVLAAGGLVTYAAYAVGRTVNAPYPPIQADRSPEGVARGAQIFHSVCEACHRPPDSERAAGAPMHEVPGFLGSFYAPNITSHPVAGIGGLRDEQIARALRFGVDRHGKRGIMGFAMGDADLAAVIGFLRSDHPLFAPDPRPSPRSKLSLIGKTVFLVTGLASVPERPAQGIPVPPRVANVEYGRYLATAVFDCVGCHTPGFSTDKQGQADAFAGGMEMRDPSGRDLRTPNLTPDASGLGTWSRDDFMRAMRTGVRSDGVAVRAPMPRFRHLDDVDLDALWMFLQALPPRRNAVPGQRPLAGHASVSAAITGADSYAQLGCAGCHGPGARYHDHLRAAQGKDPAVLAQWIRHPEAFRPGTPMPTYAAVLDDDAALGLARWISEGAVR
jgi:mono/diheme cytochrome c family protein